MEKIKILSKIDLLFYIIFVPFSKMSFLNQDKTLNQLLIIEILTKNEIDFRKSLSSEKATCDYKSKVSTAKRLADDCILFTIRLQTSGGSEKANERFMSLTFDKLQSLTDEKVLQNQTKKNVLTRQEKARNILDNVKDFTVIEKMIKLENYRNFKLPDLKSFFESLVEK